MAMMPDGYDRHFTEQPTGSVDVGLNGSIQQNLRRSHLANRSPAHRCRIIGAVVHRTAIAQHTVLIEQKDMRRFFCAKALSNLLRHIPQVREN